MRVRIDNNYCNEEERDRNIQKRKKKPCLAFYSAVRSAIHIGVSREVKIDETRGDFLLGAATLSLAGVGTTRALDRSVPVYVTEKVDRADPVLPIPSGQALFSLAATKITNESRRPTAEIHSSERRLQ